MQNILKAKRSWLATAAMVLLVTGCSDDTDFDFEGSREEFETQVAEAATPQALFNPNPGNDQVVPFPNNLLFLNSEDGTLNFPIVADVDETQEEAEADLSDPLVALNQQDGFSTTAPISTAVSKSLNNDTIELGVTVRVFEVSTADALLPISEENLAQRTLARSAITASTGEITDESALFVSAIDNQLALIPTVPLAPSTSYMVVLTNGIEDNEGNPLEPSFTYGLLKGDQQLLNPLAEGLRGVVGSHLAVLNAQLGIEPDTVALSWVFTTQSTTDVLAAVKDVSNASSAFTLIDSTLSTDDIVIDEDGNTLRGQADIFVGAITLPYYQTAVTEDDINSETGVSDPSLALNGFWQNAAGQAPGATDENGIADYLPVATTNVTVPVMMTIPNANAASGGEMPPNGWPVTIFQHGITRNRTDMLLIADAMADAGHAVVSIDMPMHGVESDSQVHASQNPLVDVERTFDIDAFSVDPETGQTVPVPDGNIDASGTHFYNLANLANSRDNLRQAVADLLVLSASLPSALVIDSQQMPLGVMLDASRMTFVGHSLGAIVGTTMLAFDTSFQAATLAMPGGGISRLLAGSNNFGPVITGGLASAGIEEGSADFELFLTAAQTMVDSGDPINHAATVSAGDTRIHLIEVIGDQTVPNAVALAPLSGTEPLISQLALPSVDTTVANSNAAVRFTEGSHGSIIDPSDSLAATAEMQMQMATFAATLGMTLPITNSDVVQSSDEVE